MTGGVPVIPRFGMEEYRPWHGEEVKSMVKLHGSKPLSCLTSVKLPRHRHHEPGGMRILVPDRNSLSLQIM